MEEIKTKKKSGASTASKTGGPFQIVESYKALRTNLLFTLATAQRKSVAIASAEPHAGKSTTAANLSIVLAQTNFKVLLIDADMRNPSLHRIFGQSRMEGLSKVLSDMQTVDEALVKQVAPNLDFLPAGPLPPNPQELLCSPKMAQLLREAETIYDYVIVDTPPLNLVADALMLTKEIAGLLLVVREGQTSYEDVRLSQDSVENIDGHILGIVLTDVKQHVGPYREKYYKSSDYDYGQ